MSASAPIFKIGKLRLGSEHLRRCLWIPPFLSWTLQGPGLSHGSYSQMPQGSHPTAVIF